MVDTYKMEVMYDEKGDAVVSATLKDNEGLCEDAEGIEWVKHLDSKAEIAKLKAKLARIDEAYEKPCEFYDPQDMQGWAHGIEEALESDNE